MSIDGPDGVIKVENGGSLDMLQLSYLAKYVPPK